MRNYLHVATAAVIVFFGFLFFYAPLKEDRLPTPADAMVGLYHPFRDLHQDTHPNGIPYKNYLITDPVRQIIPWKELALSDLKAGQMPLWNPYEMAGKPLLGNFQASPFFPLNMMLLIEPFAYSWTTFILLQQVLGFAFMYVFLRSLKLLKYSSILASFAWSFSGFFIAWLEWGTVVYTAIWLPLSLFTINKLFENEKNTNKKIFLYAALLFASTTASLFAGHTQIFIYTQAAVIAYLLVMLKHQRHKAKTLIAPVTAILTAALVTIIQWFPALQFFQNSARQSDQSVNAEGWFLPPQNLVQFIAPDFFGNPATLNYWGVWNYAEFIGYVGVVPLLLATLTIGIKKREVLFFHILLLIALIFALPHPVTSWLYQFDIVIFSSSQPTRLIMLAAFSLATLSAFGANELIKKNGKKVFAVVVTGAIILAALFAAVYTNIWGLEEVDRAVTQNNLYLPILLFGAATGAMLAMKFIKHEALRKGILLVLLALTVFDLTRFAAKFTPFSDSGYFYPDTQAIEYLRQDSSTYRIATADDRILAPSIATFYRLQSINGYDPLYLDTYAQFITLNERQETDTSPPYGFNRIIAPKNLDTNMIDFLNVKYVLSINELGGDKFEKVFEEGKTKVFKNNDVIPRANFVTEVVAARSENERNEILFNADLGSTAVVEGVDDGQYSKGEVEIVEYRQNKIVLSTRNKDEGFLVLSDTAYPTWKAIIDGHETKIYTTNIAFRGVVVPRGEHEIIFYNTLY